MLLHNPNNCMLHGCLNITTNLIPQMAYDQGTSLKLIFIIIGGAYVMILVSTFLFLPRKFITSSNEMKVHNSELEIKSATFDKNVTQDENPNIKNKPSEVNGDIYSKHRSNQDESGVIQQNEFGEARDEYIQQKGMDRLSDIELPKSNSDDCKSHRVLNMFGIKSKRSAGLLKCFFSWTFMLYLMWAAVVQLVLVMLLATFNPWLEHVTQGDVEAG